MSVSDLYRHLPATLSTTMTAHLLDRAEKALRQVWGRADFLSHEDRGRIRDVADMVAVLKKKCDGSYLEQERRRRGATHVTTR